jgi:hypothetical protein
MQQALEALKSAAIFVDSFRGQKATQEAITALSTALEQPEPGPVETYIHHYRSQSHPNDFGIPKGHWWQAKQYADAVNTTPPAAQRKPLTCAWWPENDDLMPGTYSSACGELWSFIDGGWKENNVRFCHGCGGKVVESTNIKEAV